MSENIRIFDLRKMRSFPKLNVITKKNLEELLMLKEEDNLKMTQEPYGINGQRYSLQIN